MTNTDPNQLTPKEAVKLCLNETLEELLASRPLWASLLIRLVIHFHRPKLEEELVKHVIEQRAAGRADITEEGVDLAFKRAGLPV